MAKTTIAQGVAINRLRKLQRMYDFWVQYRPATYPFQSTTWQQEMANKQIERICAEMKAIKAQQEPTA